MGEWKGEMCCIWEESIGWDGGVKESYGLMNKYDTIYKKRKEHLY